MHTQTLEYTHLKLDIYKRYVNTINALIKHNKP